MRSNEYVNCDHIIELDLNFIAMKNQFSSIRRDNNKKKKTISLSFLALDARLKMPNVVSNRVVLWRREKVVNNPETFLRLSSLAY